MEPNIEEVAGRIRALREDLDITMEEMADATGRSVAEYAAVHKLLRRPGQHRAEQNRLQHQRLILGGQSTLQVKNRNFTIHGNHPPFYNPSHYIMLCVKIQYFCVFFWQ